MQAAITRQGYRQPKLWVEAIRKELKEQEEFPADDPEKPLSRIADLVMRQFEDDRHRHIAVLTFNYDGLLEQALFTRAKEHDRGSIFTIFREEDYAASIHRSGVFIYHLHGYALSDDSPIFDAASYLRVLGSPGRHWSWDCLTTSLIQRDSGAMFIGLSLVDPSLRLLLTHWAEKGLPLSGVYISGPPPEPAIIPPSDSEEEKRTSEHETEEQKRKRAKKKEAQALEQRLRIANVTRDIVHLFDEVLDQLSLVPHHVTVWEEINDLLESIGKDEELYASLAASAV